jgi:ferritin
VEEPMDKRLVDSLNEQLREELASGYVYLGIAADMEAKNWIGTATWFKKQAHEEAIHAMKIYGYLFSRGERAVLQTIEAPKQDYNSILEAFEAALKHEKYITKRIHNLVKLAREVDDIPTESFLQWFVTEQVEEEAAPAAVVDRLKMVGDSPQILFMLDRELAARQ